MIKDYLCIKDTKQMDNYIIFGAPLTGKGTMCNLLQQRYLFNHKSTGAMIRSHQARGTRVGLLADKVGVGEGNFMPDNIISEMVKGDFIAEYAHTKKGFLLDGYPRTIAQAKDIASFMFNRKERFTALISFKADNVTLIERVKKRAEAEGRDDDTEDVLKRRLKKYEEETKPILDYFRGKGAIIELDASGTVEEQFHRLRLAMGLPPVYSAIVATGQNNEIGNGNKLLWHLPDDFKYFQEKTMGKALIMGRKTYESLGRLDLPKRHIFIVTRDESYIAQIRENADSGKYKGSVENVTVVHSIEDAIEKSNKWSDENGTNEVMVCGGEQIYCEFLNQGLLRFVYKTEVNGEFEADAFFPDLSKKEMFVNSKVLNEKDEKHEFDFSFNELQLI